MGETAQSRRPTSPALQDEAVSPSLEVITLIGGLVQDAARALFGTYGVKVDLDGSLVTKTLASVELVSIIGFSSDMVSGSLLLALPNSAVERTLPAPDSNLADWVGELANQLLGRLKNQLLDYHVVVNMSLPVVVSGGQLSLPTKTRPLTRYYSFASDWETFFVRLEVEVSPALELVREAGPSSQRGMDEGELMLF
jgi:CheY-specific phosphatase CheX